MSKGLEKLGQLAAKAASWEPFAAAAPGNPTRTEWAGLLAGLEPHLFAYAEYKYLGHKETRPKLEQIANTRGMAMALRYKWPEGTPVWSIASLAMFDAAECLLCRACGGTGVNNNQRQCERCKGDRREPYIVSGRAKARLLGIDEKTWRNKYAGYHADLYTMFCGWDGIIAAHCARKMAGGVAGGDIIQKQKL